MAQATGIQAFARASQLLGDPRYLTYARDALRRLPEAPADRRRHPRPPGRQPLPPVLVRAAAVHLQRLPAVGDRALRLLDDHRRRHRADALRQRGARGAARRCRLSDTGDWSLYSYRGRESTMEYHELLREFMREHVQPLQGRPSTARRRKRYRGYMTDPAELVFTGPATATKGEATPVTLHRLQALGGGDQDHHAGQDVADKVATFRRGNGSFAWKPGTTGTYTVQLAAKELRTGQGLRTRTSGEIESLPVGQRTIRSAWRPGRSSTRARAASARRASPPPPRGAAPPRGCARSSSPPTRRTACPTRSRPSSAAGPTEIGPCLWGQEVQAQEEMERHWEAVSGWLGELLADRGVDRISAEELTVPPGMDELFSLLQIKRHHESGEFDAIIVDCAPTGETLRLLSFPDVCTWWLEKVFPFRGADGGRGAAVRAAMLDIPLPSEAVFDDVERLVRNLVAMNDILRDRSTTSIRLVMNPDRMVVKEAMRTFTYLNLYGYLTDAVVVNRVFPEEVGEGYFGGWRERQQEQMELVRSAFSPVPILTAPYFSEEVVGARDARPARRRAVRGPRRRRRCCTRSWRRSCRPRTARATLRAGAAVRREGRHRAEEDRARGGRARRRPEADYHAAPRAGGLPDHRRAFRGRRARGRLREGRRWTTSKTTPPDAPRRRPGWGERRRRPSRHRATSRRRGRSRPPGPATTPRRATSRRPTAIRCSTSRPARTGTARPRTALRPPPPPARRLDFSALFVLLDALRRAAPAELQDRITAFIREGLLTLRSLIDWYLERLDRPPRGAEGRGHPDRLEPDPRRLAAGAAAVAGRSPGSRARPAACRAPA